MPNWAIGSAAYLILLALGINFYVSAIRFFKSSEKNQNELLKKLDELLQILRKDSQA